ncbi:MAG: glycosyl transferase family 1 [Herpetosiphonaceae bacterium]|nr:MAG: glycosyl transferase family 1 [Herpetosiphonaceae bacterium]
MHIGIDISRIATGRRTGTENYTYELLAALAQIDHRNRYTLYCNRLPAALPPLGLNFRLRRIPLPRLWTHLRLGPELRLHPPDLAFIPAHVIPALPPRRSVVTIHDLGYLYFPEAHPAAQRLYLRISTRWSAFASSHIIADSQATRNDLIRYCGTPSGKITVVPLGVSPRFAPRPEEEYLAVARHYGLEPPYLLYVGTIQPRKNLVRLIEAYAQALRQRRDLPVLALGGKRGWLTESIERRAEELNIAGRVRFLGYVDDQHLPALLSGALAFLLPSLYEGFGLPALEAMACGTPVLASSTSSLPEVVGDAALLVDPTDPAAIAEAILRLCGDTGLRAELAARGIERARLFSWRRTAHETLAVLCSVGGL